MLIYSYDPFGNILSNPTIYNPKLFIGRDDVLYDPETELYYMHARYYDPEAGRFIMKDPVEGSLGNPITQNSYIYCANDPVNKIDPGGTTPQNTGLPERYENEPQAVKWAGSNRTAFCLSPAPNNSVASSTFTIWDLYLNNGCMSGGSIIWLSLPEAASAMDTFDSCNRLFDRGTVTIGEYEVTYGWDLSGKPYVKVKPKKDGKGNRETASAIQKGMNDALLDLYNQGYDFNSHTLGSLVNDIASFMGSGGWGELANVNANFKNPYTAFYHVTVGAAIASEMGPIGVFGLKWSDTKLSEKEFSESGRKWTEKDLKILIGTAVSFENKNWNTQLGFYYSTDVWGQTTLGLVDVANLILATMKWESGFDPEDFGKHEGWVDVGLMQIKRTDISTKEEAKAHGWFNPFKSVMWGVGGMFGLLKTASSWPSATGGPPTQYEWMRADYKYQGAGVNRDLVWADLQRLSGSHIWDYDTWYASRDVTQDKLPNGKYIRWKKGEKSK